MVIIQTIKYFGRYYPNAPIDRWFCLVDEKVYDSDEMKDIFGFSDKTEIDASDSFIMLFKTDITALKRRFVETHPDPHLPKKIRAICDQKNVGFDVAFNICSETGFLHDWAVFEDKQLEQDAVSWCRENGLAYARDKENE